MSTGQFSAQLFLRLAEFVIWAERQQEVAAKDPEFARLREQCSATLTGTLDETQLKAA